MPKPDTNVEVVNDPLNVQVTNTTPVAVSGTVAVTATSPLPVTGTLTAAAAPPALASFIQLTTAEFGTNLFTVPAGMVLMIEHASFVGSIADNPQQGMNTANLAITHNGSVAFFRVPVPLSRQGSFDAGYITGPVYLKPTDVLFVVASVGGTFTLFGRLLPVS